MSILVSDIQRFCMHDGEGIRTVVFLKGCLLDCKWCHNPETKRFQPQLLYYDNKCLHCKSCLEVCKNHVHRFEDKHYVAFQNCLTCKKCSMVCPTNALSICGQEYEAEELVKLLKKDQAFYQQNGGVTFSGGEPLLQKEIVELIQRCHQEKLNINIETCGQFDKNIISKILPYVDLFLYDIKDSDETRLLKNTKGNLSVILSNLKTIDDLGGKTRLRCILLNQINTNTKHYHFIAKLYHSLKNCEGVELILYHAYSGSKSTFIGLEDNANLSWIVPEKQYQMAIDTLKNLDVKILNLNDEE